MGPPTIIHQQEDMADSADAENPLLQALPPATDYVNYLILLEYNLTKEQLPTLHGVLQDTTLTANIGWDLVPLLLPLLPESRECLLDVARLGNPREVVIKVTEGLQAIANEAEDGEDEEEELQDLDEHAERATLRPIKQPHDDNAVLVGGATGSEQALFEGKEEQSSSLKDVAPPPPILRYTTLVEMLSILHPRIKTKYPSRFLSTSLQAVLPAFSRVARDPVAMEATLDMIKSLSGTQRPKLPPRKSSSQVATLSTTSSSAPDPEGKDEVQGQDEVALQRRLVQSFLTWVVEGFVSSVPAYEDLSGLAWSCRYYEKRHPEKNIPGRPTYTAMFADEEEELHMRDSLLGQALAIARDLNLKSGELLSVITNADPPENNENDELPANAADVPLSRTGSLYLFSALAASNALFEAPISPLTLSLFPDFAAIVQNSLGASSTGQLGSEPQSAIDAVLFLGAFIQSTQPQPPSTKISESNDDNDDIFNTTLQRLSLLSANTPSPPLRYQAHLLTTSILHAHSSDQVRLAFIKDTLQHCPYENLKASAVGWLKDEILAGAAAAAEQRAGGDRVGRAHEEEGEGAGEGEGEGGIFASPAVLKTLGPDLLVNPSSLVREHPDQDAFAIFQHHQPFFLAVLNLLYLLLSSPALTHGLHIAAFVREYDVTGYCDRLRAASLLFQGWIDKGEEGNGEERSGLAELQLLDQTVGRVMEAVGGAGI